MPQSRKFRFIKGLKDMSLAQYCKILEILQRENAENVQSTHYDNVVEILQMLNPKMTVEEVKRIPKNRVISYYDSMIASFSTPYNEENLKRIVEITKGNFIGLEPNLKAMTVGMFMDIMDLSKVKTAENYLMIFSILYRPVDMYTVKLYSLIDYESEPPENFEVRSKLMGEKLTGDFGRDVLGYFFSTRTQS